MSCEYAEVRNSDFAILQRFCVDDPHNIPEKFGTHPSLDFSRAVPVVRGTDPELPDDNSTYGDFEYNIDPPGNPTQVVKTLTIDSLTAQQISENDAIAEVKAMYPDLLAGTASTADVQKAILILAQLAIGE